MVILKAPDKKSCTQVLERLRKQVEETAFPGVGHITISIGAVKVVRDIFRVTLLVYADQSLYYGKNHGRNQLNFFENLLIKGVVKADNFESGRIEIF